MAQQVKSAVLVVDDDARIRDLLCRYLVAQGMLVALAANSAEAEDILSYLQFDAVILDVMMPAEDGVSFLKRIRTDKAYPDVPVLLLTARGEVEDRISGLEAGAADYLAKPFEPRELVLRLQAIMKRTAPISQDDTATELKLGSYTYDKKRSALVSKEGGVISLTESEKTLLDILIAHEGDTLSRDKLAALVGVTGNPRTIDVQVTRLRRKIEVDPTTPLVLRTVRGEGYVFSR